MPKSLIRLLDRLRERPFLRSVPAAIPLADAINRTVRQTLLPFRSDNGTLAPPTTRPRTQQGISEAHMSTEPPQSAPPSETPPETPDTTPDATQKTQAGASDQPPSDHAGPIKMSIGTTPARADGKPTIGLALGGGVAKGWAHIGVIRAMIRAGIEPDVIAGTSIGAVVGGAYLAGQLDVLEAWAKSLTKRRLFTYLDLTFGGSGFIGGARLEKLLNRHLGQYTIEGLPKTFIAVTAELATAHEIWIRNGNLVDAVKASYALPGVFPPVNRDGRWLIDGALVNPVPTSVCRAFGSRIVIAVSLHSDSFGKTHFEEGTRLAVEDKSELSIASQIKEKFSASPQNIIMRQLFGTGTKSPGVGSVMLGALNIVMDRLSRSRLAGDPPDVLLTPRLGHISLLDFDRAEESIRLGEEAFERELPMIKEAIAILS